MEVGYISHEELRYQFLLKDIEIWKLKNRFDYENIIKELNEGTRLILCPKYYIENLIPLIDFYGLEAVEKALKEIAEKEKENVASNQHEN